MMYFTESGEMLESPFELNAAFEGEYDSAEYEVKISKLMSHAYARLKKEDPSSARIWVDSVQELRKGDHYLLVFLDQTPIGIAPSKHMFGWTFWKVLGIGILVLIVGLVVFYSDASLFGVRIAPVAVGKAILAFRSRSFRFATYFIPTSFSNSDSVRIVTPSSFALYYAARRGLDTMKSLQILRRHPGSPFRVGGT